MAAAPRRQRRCASCGPELASPHGSSQSIALDLIVASFHGGSEPGIEGDLWTRAVTCRDACRYEQTVPVGSRYVLLAEPSLGLPPELMFDTDAIFLRWSGCQRLGGQVADDAESGGEVGVCFGRFTGDPIFADPARAVISADFVARPRLTVEIGGQGAVTEKDRRDRRDAAGLKMGDFPIGCRSADPESLCTRRLMRSGNWSSSVLTATPARRWRFERWAGCPQAVGPGGRTCVVPPDLRRFRWDVEALFAPEGPCGRFRGPSCIKSVTYTGAGSAISRAVDPASNACAVGNWSSNDVAWRDTFVGTQRLYDGNGLRARSSRLSGAFRFDLDCGILHQHCTGTISNTNPVLATVHGREGDWTLDVEAYDGIPAHSGCHEGPDGDFTIIRTFVGRIHLRGTPGHPRARAVALTVKRTSGYTPQPGERESSSVRGRLVVTGVW